MIVLDDNYRIVTHEYNFILQRKIDPDKNPRKGKRATSAEKWKNIGYTGRIYLNSWPRTAMRS